MRLKLIKLAGFKSFVEPTRIELNADMTAVVGPNGCGKSNVIDAVRWVLGESSARHLRGENMTDVIFNGSVNRSAHGRASVELVFDNPHNRVPGEFGRFTEISVRREVLRDGSNHYQINGQKCRRKDVTDLFLGTGLGPRSYAIIEQGTVSRLVESRPADLKLFMEEAAGSPATRSGAARPSSAYAIPRRTWSAWATSAANWAHASSISRPRPRPPSATSSSRVDHVPLVRS